MSWAQLVRHSIKPSLSILPSPSAVNCFNRHPAKAQLHALEKCQPVKLSVGHIEKRAIDMAPDYYWLDASGISDPARPRFSVDVAGTRKRFVGNYVHLRLILNYLHLDSLCRCQAQSRGRS